MGTFTSDGKADMMMNDTMQNEAQKPPEKSFNTDSPRYVHCNGFDSFIFVSIILCFGDQVIFSRTNQSTPVIGRVQKDDSQQFALAVGAENETEDFPNLPGIGIVTSSRLFQ